MTSPIAYRQSPHFETLQNLVGKAFNPLGTYRHYRSLAKKTYLVRASLDIENSEHKELKRFFYLVRATLSAKWIVQKQAMPSIVFYDV